MAFEATQITEHTWEGIKCAVPDYETILLSVLDLMLDRYERTPDYPFIDTKLSTITGEDFAHGPDPARDFRGRGVIYGWIQGRGLEALAGHAEFLPRFSTLDREGCDRRVARIRPMLREIVEGMEEIRKRNGGHVFFSMSPDGQPLTIDDDGRLAPTELPSDACNISDLFYAKGLYAAASYLEDAERMAAAVKYFRRVLDDVEAETLYMDQQPLDPKNKVRPVPGRHIQGPRMVALGGLALLAYQTLESEWIERGAEFVDQIIGRHVNLGEFHGLEMYDWVEAVDDDGKPWVDEGRILSDTGHCLEFVGLAGKLFSMVTLLEEASERVEQVERDACAMLTDLLTHNFEIGWNAEAGGIRKAFDLASRTPINTDMPWWSLPETMRAVAYVGEPPCRIFADCSNAFLGRFVNPKARLMAFQTRNAQGRPVDTIPATPDADPGYHTGLSMIDVLGLLKEI